MNQDAKASNSSGTNDLNSGRITPSGPRFGKFLRRKGSADSYASTSTDATPRSTNDRAAFPAMAPLDEDTETLPYTREQSSSSEAIQTGRQPYQRHASDSSVNSLPAVTSPVYRETVERGRSPAVSMPSSSRPPTPSRRLLDRIASPSPSRSGTPVQSSSRLHWNQIRAAIKPGGPLSSAASSPAASVTSFAASGVPVAAAPPRSQTPKPSRLARLGFRQVVEQTRIVAAEEMDSFKIDIYQACLRARFGSSRPKEMLQPGYLPFMSSASLTANVTFNTGKSSITSETVPPSLKELHNVLLRYASAGSNNAAWDLPYESEVLSALLTPFVFESRRNEDDQWLAIESFELAVQTWRASSTQGEVERLLWCCKAGLIPASSVRSRVLGTLSNMLFSSKPLQDATPLALQNLFQGLQLLVHTITDHPSSTDGDIEVTRELLSHVYEGGTGDLLPKSIEQEYGAEWSSHDTQDSLRIQIISEATVRCMQCGSEELRRWALRHQMKNYWPSSIGPSTALCRAVVTRRLMGFLQSSLALLRLDMSQHRQQALRSDSSVIYHLIMTRTLAELQQLPSSASVNDCRNLVVQLLLELLEVDNEGQNGRINSLLCHWYSDDHDWKVSLGTGLRVIIDKADWTVVVRVVRNMMANIPEDPLDKLIAIVIPAVHARLVLDPALNTTAPLSTVFEQLAQRYPQLFYLPLFALANAAKEPTLVAQLSIVTALARHLPSFWTRDPEMMSIAIMADGKKTNGDQPVIWAKTRLGQCLIIVELIRSIRELIKLKRDPSVPPDSNHNDAYKFVVGLEGRLAVLLENKEAEKFIPFSQRLLLSTLLLEIRLYTRSVKPASWMKTIVRWSAQSYVGATLIQSNNPFADNTPLAFVGDEAYFEQSTTLQKLRLIYAACSDTPISSARHRSTVAASSYDALPSAGLVESFGAINEAVKERQDLLDSFPASTAAALLRLLVAMFASLSHPEYQVLGPTIWSHYLEEHESTVVAPACFLMTHCLERSPDSMLPLIKDEMKSPSTEVKSKVIGRLMTLFSWRADLLGQTYITDRAHRRPFKLARHPIPFVAIDVGSSVYVHEQSEDELKTLSGGALPYDIRKKLAEVGWDQDDSPTDTRMEKIRAPISLFSITNLETFYASRGTDPFSGNGNGRPLLRRKSSGASSQSGGNKRRAVFVPALISLFPMLSLLAADLNPFVASAAREALLIILRDDPGMLCRPVLESLSSDLLKIRENTSTLRAFLHIHHRLPPAASQHIFSNLGGFLKHIAKESDNPEALKAFSYSVPILSRLITQVSSLTARDLRRSKFEIFVFPTGSLWFPSTAPSSPMFPRALTSAPTRSNEVPEQMALVTMIRTAQNMLFLDILKHKPHEVQTVRKSLLDLALPGENTGKGIETSRFLPKFGEEEKPPSSYEQVSLALSRSHLLLLAQVFRSMPRNFNGKQELTRLFDGLNRIMLAHGNDIGVVAHALIVCMIGATRFRRSVSANGGFTLFMPVLLKAYAEADPQTSIRQAIHYASSRFYAIHEESYLFQSLEIASQIISRIEAAKDKELFADAVWDLFSSLKSAIRPGSADPTGIHGCNKSEEKEVLIAAAIADDTLTSPNSEAPQGERLKKIMEIEEFPSKVLQLDDLARLFLTIVAHDPTILRAQHFLLLFRHLTPRLYHGSRSSRDVLRDGINALSVALFAKSSRTKVAESDRSRSTESAATEDMAKVSSKADNVNAPGDPVIIRREYLKLVVAFIRMGGDLRQGTVRQALELVKGLLKEVLRPEPQTEGTFLHDFLGASLNRLSITAKHAYAVLSDVAPILRTFALSIDCSSAIDSITQLLQQSELTKAANLIQIVVEEIAAPLLEACTQAASDNLLMSLPIRQSLINLLAQLATVDHADICSIIEVQPPSPGFLCGIVLPLAMTIKTSTQIAAENQFQTKLRAARHGIIFVRILAYVMGACQTNQDGDGVKSSLPQLNRRGSNSSRKGSLSAARTELATMAISMQIIKVIVLRATDDVSNGLIGIWSRVAKFLGRLLSDGDAQFALPPQTSPGPSPYHSPQLTPIRNDPFLQQPLSPSALTSPSNFSTRSAPRVVDYLTWSLMEYLCCAPSPLNLQMRLWMQEKANILDTELKARELPTPISGRRSRRLSTSVFAKPRGSSVSPDALRPQGNLSRTPSELNLSLSVSPEFNPTDFAAYNRFPSPATPSNRTNPWNGPKITHLGPSYGRLEPPPFILAPPESPLKNLARISNITLLELIQMTRTRIRVVQICMGFDRLLPSAPSAPFSGIRSFHDQDTTDVNLKPWTKASALGMIVAETKLLMEEFPECFREDAMQVGGAFVEVGTGSSMPGTPTSPRFGASGGGDMSFRVPSSPTPNSNGRVPILF